MRKSYLVLGLASLLMVPVLSPLSAAGKMAKGQGGGKAGNSEGMRARMQERMQQRRQQQPGTSEKGGMLREKMQQRQKQRNNDPEAAKAKRQALREKWEALRQQGGSGKAFGVLHERIKAFQEAKKSGDPSLYKERNWHCSNNGRQ